jgi:asparagine synthetase B (glutamine-hydrolysing)
MIRTFLSEDILSFADSVAMASSAELRMPFLDRDLVHFVFGLPRAMRVSPWPGRANTKQVLRFWAERHLPAEVATRRKRNFNYGTVRDLLRQDGPMLRGWLLDSSAVRRALPGLEPWLDRPMESFRGPWEGTLWALLTLAIWCEANGVH